VLDADQDPDEDVGASIVNGYPDLDHNRPP
jgi:hypothetical protein